MDEADLVGVHEAGVAHHVAAVGEVDGEDRAAAVGYGGSPVVVELLIVVGADVAAGEYLFEVAEEGGVDGHDVFKVAVDGAVLDHEDFAVALDDLGLDLADLLVQQNLVRKLAIDDLLADQEDALGAEGVGGAGPAEGAASLSDSSSRKALSASHRANAGAGGHEEVELSLLNTTQPAFAACVRARSPNFIGFAMCVMSPEDRIRGSCSRRLQSACHRCSGYNFRYYKITQGLGGF